LQLAPEAPSSRHESGSGEPQNGSPIPQLSLPHEALLSFEIKGTPLEAEFGSGDQTKFLQVNYKNDWALIRRIDQEFVSTAKVEPPNAGAFVAWKNDLLTKLRRLTFHHFPERIPAAVPARDNREAQKDSSAREDARPPGLIRLNTEPGISIRLRAVKSPAAHARRILILVTGSDVNAPPPGWLEGFVKEQDAVYVCEPRGIGPVQWTHINPPNYVARSHYLLGRTVDSGRVWDIAATARYLQALRQDQSPVFLVGENALAVLAIYAALLEPSISGLILHQPSATHMDDSAPALLNVLRVCDIPDAVGMLAPRPITLVGNDPEWFPRVASIYRAAGASDKLVVKK
jgi:hypothetical protein